MSVRPGGGRPPGPSPDPPRHPGSSIDATLRDRPPSVAATTIGVLLLGCWLLAATTDGTAAQVGVHLVYVPIVLGAARFGAVAGLGLGLAATSLTSPLVTTTSTGLWLGRGVTYVLVGVLAGLAATARVGRVTSERNLATRERDMAQRELDLAHGERTLIAQRAALVQLVSHEIRTPLTVIRGSIETLSGRPDAVHPSFAALLDATRRATTRLDDMLDVILAASDELEPKDTEPSTIEVTDLVHHAATSLPSDVRPRLRFDLEGDARLVSVEPYLWLTVRCLLDNAAKFSPAASPITVTYRRLDDVAVLSLRDQGRGIPDGFLDLAFEPFTQADDSERREAAGIGMGLYTARRLARRLGGDIEVVSSPVHGVTATIVLPQGGNDLRNYTN